MLCIQTGLRLGRIHFVRSYAASAAAPTEPLLLKRIRDDLKLAMRAKDRVRLDTIRGLLSDTTNAAKTANPTDSDAKVLGLIKKRIKSSQDAANEASSVGREDLAAQEKNQISILDAYVTDANPMTGDELKSTVLAEVERLRSQGGAIKNKGMTMAAILKQDGLFAGRFVDKQEIAQIVNRALESPA